MFRTSSLILIAVCLIAVPADLRAAATEKFRNLQVIVTEETLAPGETASLSGDRPDMLVFLTGEIAEIAADHADVHSRAVKRGDTIFEAAGEKSIKNDGASTLSYVRVEFLNKGNQETWGMTGLSPKYTPLIENEYARAYDIKISAQTFEPPHSHRDRVIICLSGGEIEHTLPNGEKQPSTLKTGDIGWRPPATHVGHNTGHTDLWIIAIEPK